MLRLPKKPPFWILFAGPPLGGLASGLSGARLDRLSAYTDLPFWQQVAIILLIALPVALLPSLIYHLWRRASKD